MAVAPSNALTLLSDHVGSEKVMETPPLQPPRATYACSSV